MKKRILRTILLTLMAACLTAGMAYAEGTDGQAPAETAVDTPSAYGIDGDVTLSIKYVIPGVKFSLYKIAEFTPDAAAYTLNAPYDSLGVKLPDGSDTVGSTDWTATATSFYNQMVANLSSYTPAAEVTTAGSKDAASATFAALPAGLYLLFGEEQLYEDAAESGVYTPTPMLVSLPYEVADGSWVMTPSVEIKYTYVPAGDKTVEKEYTVKKLWAGEYTTEKRPASITVKITCNGKDTVTQTLSAANNWTYTWKGLDTDTYTVAEDPVPDGYTVTVTSSGETFTITNTMEKEPDPDGELETPSEEDTEEETVKKQTEKKQETPPPAQGVKTGDDTPVIGLVTALAAAGLAIIVLGIVLIRRRRAR